MKERGEDAMFVTCGYTMELRCCKCHGNQMNNGIMEELYTDGPKCYYEARRWARKKGWILHKDGYATCPECAKKPKPPNLPADS